MRAADDQIPVGEPTYRRFRQAAAMVVFGTWMIVGLFLDGWSHIHQRPESFLTPWHGVLYSGFLVGVLWFAIDQRTAGRTEVGLIGGRLTFLGFVIFGAAAVGDFGWHTLFGIERNVAALLSPTHLLLMTGGILLVTAPVRDAWHERRDSQPRWGEFWPVVGSLTLTVALVLFFLQYLSPFRAAIVAQPLTTAFRSLNETAEIRTIGSVLVTTVVLVGVMLFILRRWTPPVGTFTILFGVPAVAMSGLDSFQRLPLALCAVAGGLVADIAVEADAPVRWVAAAVPVAAWLPYFVVFKVAYDLPWTIHLWLGTVFLTGLTGLGLSLLTAPPQLPPD